MNYYAEAIKILLNEKNISKELIYKIAEQSPAAIVKAAKSIGIKIEEDILKEIVLKSNTHIEAIKKIREITHWGLLESKNYVESISKNWA